MPREIADRDRVVEAVKTLALTAELFEEQNGKPKYAGDLEVIVHGRDYGNGKQVGPYVRLLTYDGDEEITRQGEWGGNTFYIGVAGALDVYVDDQKVGYVTSGGPAPFLKKNIGLAFLPPQFAIVGQEIKIDVRGKRLKAQVVPTPFYKRPR